MKIAVLLLGLWFSWAVQAAQTVQDDDAWMYQSYKQSKRLPDLHHAVDVKLLPEMKPPVEFELKTGRILQCKTCHGLKQMDEIAYDKVNLDDPAFLRGGPYQDLESFCYQCHSKKEHERPNIHVMLDENGAIKEENCLYCHVEVNRHREKPRRIQDTNLRLPVSEVCLGCHLKTPHLNALEHLAVKPKDNMKKHIQDTEKKHGILIPMGSDGKVTCVSCHSPHPEGVITSLTNPAGKQVKGDVEKGIEYSKHSWDRVYQADKKDRLEQMALTHGERYAMAYERIKTEVLLRLPAKNGELCLGCHEFDR